MCLKQIPLQSRLSSLTHLITTVNELQQPVTERACSRSIRPAPTNHVCLNYRSSATNNDVICVNGMLIRMLCVTVVWFSLCQIVLLVRCSALVQDPVRTAVRICGPKISVCR